MPGGPVVVVDEAAGRRFTMAATYRAALPGRPPAQSSSGSTHRYSTLAYLARVLKTQGWSHEEYLASVLQRQVADREASGTRLRIAGAHFPAIK